MRRSSGWQAKQGKMLRCGLVLVCVVAATVLRGVAQSDSGPRPGPANAGGPIKNLKPEDEKLFWASWQKYKRLYSVSGNLEKGAGLGPSFNGTGCSQCHAQPAAGGSSPSPNSPQVRKVIMRDHHPTLGTQANPQVALASLDRLSGKEQVVPSFITESGPIRVPHFISAPDGTPDGSTHQIYTIAGRVDAPGCEMAQPNFEEQIKLHNVSYRIPSPTYGAGLIESVSDEDLIANHEATAAERKAAGIKGRFNRSSNDNSIMRFGWKAQNKSLLIFSAESYNVEMGVTSEAFPNKRAQSEKCVFNALPEDRTRVELASTAEQYQPSAYASDIVNFAAFMRFSAAPVAVTATKSELNGKALFTQVGCVLCHSESLKTGSSTFQGMSQQAIEPYSDFALHHMGLRLSDGISQGSATPDEFRTAPLWGVGQRIFFLHDGRTDDLMEAIAEHADKAGSRKASLGSSEADVVISQFDALTKEQKQDILNFLRSL